MFEKIKNEAIKKKEGLKTAGKITLGLIGVGTLGYLLGFKGGVETFLEWGLKYNEKDKEDSEEVENKEEGEA